MYNKFVVEGKNNEEKKNDSFDEGDSQIMSDEEEEVKNIEKDFKKKHEPHIKSELEELE